MSRAFVILNQPQDRERAAALVFRATLGTCVELQDPGTRTAEQNRKMWALLTRLAKNLEWHGEYYPAEAWRDYFMHELKGAQWMPHEKGGMVPIGRSSGSLSVAEHHELITLIKEFAARQGVEL